MALSLISEGDSGQPYLGRANNAITLVAVRIIIVVVPSLLQSVYYSHVRTPALRDAQE